MITKVRPEKKTKKEIKNAKRMEKFINWYFEAHKEELEAFMRWHARQLFPNCYCEECKLKGAVAE